MACGLTWPRPWPKAGTSCAILTDRDAAALEVLRHTTAHVLAQAMRRLYGPAVQYTIGPALTDDFQYGFYYDFELPEPIGQEDLEKIEREMQKIVAAKLPIRRAGANRRPRPRRDCSQLGQGYKVEMIDDLAAKEGVGRVSLYEQGDFTDLCRGPHLRRHRRVKAFKLLSVAGAYWRGNEANKMLTRIYGVAFFDKKALAEHLERVEEAKARDHRVLGKQLGLFLLSDTVGPGLPLWMPKRHHRPPATGRLAHERTGRPRLPARSSPRTSAGWTCTAPAGITRTTRTRSSRPSRWKCPGRAEEGYLLKPMNCPHHIQIYKASQHSYRDLPVRLAEFGTVYRMEQSGELNGMIRVRGFTQDDAHIFCTPEQVEAEIASCVDLTKLVLETLGLSDYRVRIGLRDPAGDKYVGDIENWEMAEENIRHVLVEDWA